MRFQLFVGLNGFHIIDLFKHMEKNVAVAGLLIVYAMIAMFSGIKLNPFWN